MQKIGSSSKISTARDKLYRVYSFADFFQEGGGWNTSSWENSARAQGFYPVDRYRSIFGKLQVLELTRMRVPPLMEAN